MTTYHLQLHVEMCSIESHAGGGGEHAVQEGEVRQAAVVGAAAAAVRPADVQDLHHFLTDQRHDQAGAK